MRHGRADRLIEELAPPYQLAWRKRGPDDLAPAYPPPRMLGVRDDLPHARACVERISWRRSTTLHDEVALRGIGGKQRQPDKCLIAAGLKIERSEHSAEGATATA